MSDWKPSTQEVDAAERELIAAFDGGQHEPDGYYRSLAEAVAIAIHEAREQPRVPFALREGDRVRLTSPEGGPPRLYLVGKPNGNHFPLTPIQDEGGVPLSTARESADAQFGAPDNA